MAHGALLMPMMKVYSMTLLRQETFENIIFRDGFPMDRGYSAMTEKTQIWLLIRHAAPFLNKLGHNCVELLAWSQNKSLEEVQEQLRLFTLDKTVDGKSFVPMELFPKRHKRVAHKQKTGQDVFAAEEAHKIIFKDMKSQR